MTDSGSLLSEDRGGVRTLTLNRPDRRNALDSGLWVALADALRDLKRDRDVRALILTGAGGAFCSGADLSDVRGDRHQLEKMRDIADVALRLHRLAKPTIAKVGGVAAGAGCNLALGCDLIVASEDARFSEIFAKRGLSIDFGGSYLLPRLVGLHKAKELAFFADIISAQEAAELGIVNRVVPAAELDAFVTSHKPGDAVPLVYESRGATINATLTFEENPRIEIVTFEKAGLPVSDEVRKFRERWVGGGGSR